MRAFSSRRQQSYLSNFLGLPTRIIILFILFLVILFPFYWMISNAFKVEQEYYSNPPIMFPTKITFQNFVDLVQKYELLKGLMKFLVVYWI